MFATVTIQTYNHAKTLAKTLESLRTLRCPNGSDYEILVVNNNSSDDTADVIKRYAKILAPRLCSIFESRQGLSHARNRALKEAKGEIVCFTDDDVRVDPEWLIAITEAFEKYDASIVGGRSYIIFPEGMQKPEWLTERFEKLWSRLDYGDEVLVGTDKDLYGLNFSVLKEAALKVGGFDPNLGRNGKHLISGEEKDLQNRTAKAGGIAVYEPNAIVGHIIPKHRLSKRWFLKRCFWGAVSIERLRMQKEDERVSMLGAFVHAVRCSLSIVKSWFLGDFSLVTFMHKALYASSAWGSVCETVRFASSRLFWKIRGNKKCRK